MASHITLVVLILIRDTYTIHVTTARNISRQSHSVVHSAVIPLRDIHLNSSLTSGRLHKNSDPWIMGFELLFFFDPVQRVKRAELLCPLSVAQTPGHVFLSFAPSILYNSRFCGATPARAGCSDWMACWLQVGYGQTLPHHHMCHH